MKTSLERGIEAEDQFTAMCEQAIGKEIAKEFADKLAARAMKAINRDVDILRKVMPEVQATGLQQYLKMLPDGRYEKVWR